MDKIKLESNHNKERTEKEININVMEVLFTPLTCASIVNEIIKCLLYQKSQIPYPYSWLRSVINRRRQTEVSTDKTINLLAEKHYHTVATAYDSLEKIINNVNSEFKTNGDYIKQVLIVFGSTVYSAKEIYTIKVSGLVTNHKEENHMYTNSKHQHKILRNVIFSEEWTHAMNSSILPTNMYVLIEKYDNYIDELSFDITAQYSISPLVKNISINLSYKEDGSYNCCNDLLIFQDLNNKQPALNTTLALNSSSQHNETVDNLSNRNLCREMHWIQSKAFVKGFKECFINGISATELW